MADASTTARRIERWLVEYLAGAHGLEPGAIDVRLPFRRLGLDSLAVLRMTEALGAWLGRALSPVMVWEFPCIAALAGHLAGEREPSRSAPPAGERRSVEPIAIVGLACRLPGAADAAAFWQLLGDGRDAIREVPADRWAVDAFHDPDPAAPGKAIARRAAFLDRVDQFDPGFFGISPREAREIDPQQRLLLELAWEALEHAGVPARSLLGSRTGVFVGCMWRDYADLAAGQLHSMNSHRATGQAINMLANRVSYALGLEGPSMAVDTACSSSLVAVHLACQSLREGDADLALAGGVNLILAPATMVGLSKFGGLAADGRSKAFDASADGYGRGEGAALVALKRLSCAIRDGDRVHAVLRATAVNNDGFSNGLTAPNPRAQAELLRAAYRRAGVSPSSVHYVEAHGTGTSLGDPIEAGALGAVLGDGREADRPLLVGSVKTNIGHLEGAAGVAGLVKTVLAMQARLVPATLHLENENPHIDFEALRLAVPRHATPWPAPDDDAAIAGVSSFGWGGTNAHAVVEGPPPPAAWVALAAPDPASLRLAAHEVLDLARAPGATLAGIAGRAAAAPAGPERVVFLARTVGGLVAELEAFERGEPGGVRGRVPDGARRVVFLCTPHGSQRIGMGRDLLASDPVFRSAFLECDRAWQALAGWSLVDELLADRASARLDDIDVVQPLLFALQRALAARWRAWGVEPDAVVGHCLGEIVAAHLAGVLDLDDALLAVLHFSRAQSAAHGQGGMAVVQLPAAEVRPRIDRFGARLTVAGENARRSTLLSGEIGALDSLLTELRAGQVTCGMVRIPAAVHGPQMEPHAPAMAGALAGLRPRPAERPMFSTVTATWLDGGAFDGRYLATNLTHPVRLAEATEALLADGYDVFVELAPHPVLLEGVADDIAASGRAAFAFAGGGDDPASMLETRARLFALGVGRGAGQGAPERPVLLPVSARSEEALRARAGAMAAWLERRPDVDLADVGHTAAVRRSHLDHRMACVGRTRREVIDRLGAFAAGGAPAGVWSGQDGSPRVLFVFSGQGSQWPGMGADLLRAEPVFRAAIQECDRRIARAGWSLVDELAAGEERSRLGETAFAQPALVAIEIGLVRLLRSWGIEPAAVLGHSVGEIAAAHVAGALTLDDAIDLAVRRGEIMQRASGRGAMSALAVDPARAAAVLRGLEDRLDLAAVNGPRSVVLSGDVLALEQATAILRAEGVEIRPLRVDCAFHSPQMTPLAEELRAALAGLRATPGAVPLYSTVDGTRRTGAELDADYWARNLRQTVRFADAFAAARADGFDVVVEIGPHPVLLRHLDEAGSAGAPAVARAIPTLRRAQDGARCMLACAAALYTAGAALDWAAIAGPGHVVDLPAYPWQRRRYWLEASPAATASVTPLRAAHPGAASAPADWFYRLAWEPRTSPGEALGSGRRIAILGDGGETARALTACLEVRGTRVARIADPAALARLAAEAPVHDLVDLRALARSGADAATAEAAAADLVDLAAQLGSRSPRLWLITCGAQPGRDGAVAAPAQAVVWGLGRVLAIEHPAAWGGLVDLDPDRVGPDRLGARDQADLLARLILEAGDEDQLALRGGGVRVARLIPAEAPSAAPVALRSDAAYLVTGGLGRIGLAVAGWLARSGARHLVLAGRSQPTEDSAADVARLAALGVSVRAAAVDVADRAAVEHLLDGLERPLAGVFHAAGLCEWEPLASGRAREVLARAFRAKVHGTMVLDAAARARGAELFVLFSSGVGIWSSRGQGAYAAANQFLDAVAAWRRAGGQPATSIAWGLWGDGGIGDARMKEQLAGIGLLAMDNEPALAALGQVIAGGGAHAVVAALDRGEFGALHRAGGRRHLLDPLDASPTPARSSALSADPGGLGRRLAQVTRPRAKELLVDWIAGTLARVLDYPPGERPPLGRGFVELGLDSLLAAQLVRELGVELGRALPPVLAFEHPNVLALAESLLAASLPAEPAPAAPAAEPADDDDDLSEDELAAQLAARLARAR